MRDNSETVLKKNESPDMVNEVLWNLSLYDWNAWRLGTDPEDHGVMHLTVRKKNALYQ